jgi:hypothetical protein
MIKADTRWIWKITIHENDTSIQNNFNLPIFNSLNIMEMAGQDYATMFNNEKGLEVSFDLKKDVNQAVLRYTSTGHGGWGNGDEFVPKENKIYLDGNLHALFRGEVNVVVTACTTLHPETLAMDYRPQILVVAIGVQVRLPIPTLYL